MKYRLVNADVIDGLRSLADCSVDAIVTDPPYGLGFMGKEWDTFKPENVAKEMLRDTRTQKRRELYGGRESDAPSAAMAAARYDLSLTANRRFQDWCETWARECLRVLKPGGHLLCFGGSRTYHRMACAIEDAGFEIRDQLQWLYGSGFPKSLDVSKAIDRHLGAEPRVVGKRAVVAGVAFEQSTPYATGRTEIPITEAETAAAALQGWGTALKPSHEPIVMARKPFTGTVAENVLRHGSGAINIDACRIETADEWSGGGPTKPREIGIGYASSSSSSSHPLGRWPANVILDETAAKILDEQSGALISGVYSGRRNEPKTKNTFGQFALRDEDPATYGDTGGASRFFYTAKASGSERSDGVDHLPEKLFAASGGAQGAVTDGDDYDAAQSIGLNRISRRRNNHPTVKPISLMRWLVKLVTPKGGIVLDPFVGSGSTGCAVIGEGFDFIGIDRELEYLEIARARIANIAPLYAVEVFD